MVLAVAGSALLVGFQISLLRGFTEASAILVKRSGADVWVVPKGIRAVELSDRMDIGVLDIVRSATGVQAAEEVVIGMTRLQTAAGERTSVTVVGVPAGARAAFPKSDSAIHIPFETGVYDVSNMRLIDPRGVKPLAEIGGVPFSLTPSELKLPSFLGTPHTFVKLEAARAAIGMPASATSYVLAWLTDRSEQDQLINRLNQRLEHVEALSSAALSNRVASFWLLQTGAGGGFLLAATLGLIIGALTVSQLLWINVLESRSVIAGLVALGIPPFAVRSALSLQGLLVGTVGAIIGMAVLIPTLHLTAQAMVPWIAGPSSSMLWVVAGAAIIGFMAAQPPAMKATKVDPATALRTL